MAFSLDGLPGLDGLSLSAGSAGAARGQNLGQDEFFELMLTQLKNQDPFKPLESGEFLSQIAQFSSVKSLGDLNTSFATLSASMISNQALQGAALIGHTVRAQTYAGVLPAGGQLTGGIELDVASSALRIQVHDAAGQLVREFDLGAQPSGIAEFRWGGETDFGTAAAPGTYTVTAQYFDGVGMQSVPVMIDSLVESVSMGPNGLSVHIAGVGELPFSAVREIG